MRMWAIDPRVLCRQHLLGEHVEMHMFVGTINKGISISGYLRNGLVDPSKIKARHEALAAEMASRGMNHNSPLPETRRLRFWPLDIEANLEDLLERCPECRKRNQMIQENQKEGV